jgi:heme-degrading monooxygenase HmoA
VTITGAKNIDAGIEYIKSTVAPVLHQQNGFRGTTTSVDRSNSLLGVLSLWETAADREASDSALLKVRDEAQKIVGGKLTVELFEEVLFETFGGPPVAGSYLLVTRVKSERTKVDENLDYFKREVLPRIKTGPGLLAVRQMVNRETGESIVGTVWADQDSMRAAAEAAAERQRTTQMPVTIVSRSEREIVYVDFP